MKIFLMGFMGAGKSSLGIRLAKVLDYDFIDLDELIEEIEGQSIQEIFEDKGERYFRKLETNTLKSLRDRQNVVVSLGGGTPCQNKIMEWIKKNGISIYIQTSQSLLVQRLYSAKAKRPLIKALNKKELIQYVKAKMNQRRSFYNQAVITVRNDRSLKLMVVKMKKRLTPFLPAS